ncbi:hypothetical protein [Paenibacillus xerothermodurans]|nr:hypothetical protein [Paenibacillus xerothermodurans]
MKSVTLDKFHRIPIQMAAGAHTFPRRSKPILQSVERRLTEPHVLDQ